MSVSDFRALLQEREDLLRKLKTMQEESGLGEGSRIVVGCSVFFSEQKIEMLK